MSEISGIPPALPILASQLLEREADRYEHSRKAGVSITGIKSVDAELPDNFWSCGSLIGISETREEDDGDKLALYLLANFLLSKLPPKTSATVPGPSAYPPKPNTPEPALQENSETNDEPGIKQQTSTSVFLISPATNSPFTPQAIISALRHLSPSQPQSTLIPLLSSVSLLRYFDITGLTEIISEVSSTLHTTRQSSHSHPPKSLILLDGLDTALSTLRRRTTTPLNANALLSSLLRQIQNISSVYPSTLILVTTVAQARDPSDHPTTSSTFSSGISSAFAASPITALTALTPPMRRQPQTAEAAPPPTPMISSSVNQTAQILEQALMKWVLVHYGTGQRGVRVVEVVRDEGFVPTSIRTTVSDGVGGGGTVGGGGMGCWGFWKK